MYIFGCTLSTKLSRRYTMKTSHAKWVQVVQVQVWIDQRAKRTGDASMRQLYERSSNLYDRYFRQLGICWRGPSCWSPRSTSGSSPFAPKKKWRERRRWWPRKFVRVSGLRSHLPYTFKTASGEFGLGFRSVWEVNSFTSSSVKTEEGVFRA